VHYSGDNGGICRCRIRIGSIDRQDRQLYRQTLKLARDSPEKLKMLHAVANGDFATLGGIRD
jgi:hypothetical protein